MSDKKPWESMEQFQAEIDQWRARADSAETELLRYAEMARKAAAGLTAAVPRFEAAEARVAEMDTALRMMVETFGWSHTSNTYRHGGINALIEAFSALGLRDGCTAEELWPK